MGILSTSYWCKKPHWSPFMHMPRSQYVHTVCTHTTTSALYSEHRAAALLQDKSVIAGHV